MNFQVPQYIDVEDKIFGPLTFKQFAYLAGGAGLCFIIYVYVGKISTILAIIAMFPFGLMALGLAFYPVNGRPMVATLESGFKYIWTKKLYLWKKNPNKPAITQIATTADAAQLPKLSASKLKDLSWSLDINQTTNPDHGDN